MKPERRTRMGLIFTVGTACLIVTTFFGIGLVQRIGLSTKPLEIERTGTAEVTSCSTSAVDFWLTTRCRAQVRWEGDRETVAEKVLSVRDVSGTTVNVHQRNTGLGGRFQSRSSVTTADYPFRHNTALLFATLLGGATTGMGLGLLLGACLDRLLPEPPPEERVLRPMRRTPRRHKRPRKH